MFLAHAPRVFLSVASLSLRLLASLATSPIALKTPTSSCTNSDGTPYCLLPTWEEQDKRGRRPNAFHLLLDRDVIKDRQTRHSFACMASIVGKAKRKRIRRSRKCAIASTFSLREGYHFLPFFVEGRKGEVRSCRIGWRTRTRACSALVWLRNTPFLSASAARRGDAGSEEAKELPPACITSTSTSTSSYYTCTSYSISNGIKMALVLALALAL